jgi:hypothetical protein
MFEKTPALWRRLLGRPDPSAMKTVEDERRVWVRFPADVATRVVTASRDDEPGLAALIRDISRGGAKLAVGREFEPGSMLTVVLPSANGKSSLSVLACVVHCDAAGANTWHVGCSFSAELDDDDLSWFGAVKARPLGPDGRNWTRFPCDVTARVQRLSDDDPRHYPARVRDISASGVAFVVDSDIPTGTLLNAELHGASERTFTILACVVHVTAAPEGGHILGCNFIRELSESDLQSLM